MRSARPTTNGPAIRYHRLSLGLDVRSLAAATKISESHLANVENGRRGLSAALLLKVAKELGVTLADISDVRPPANLVA
jgi:transcriptional regulator with XRE-family HTH domain